ncbi:MAG: DNA repair protein RecO [Desulfovibrionales bacterium]|nr:DNA repair protein RecO [Desulfovibrionales bacterium]
MSGFCSDAILLRKTEYGDHDYIISFLTRDRGKISAIAKNAKKSVQRFSGALDLFSVNHIQCSRPKKNKNGLMILGNSEIKEGFLGIRYDVFKTAHACFWMELIGFWLEEGRPQADIYDLVAAALKLLDTSNIFPRVISILFQIRFMGISGFAPNLEYCDRCNRSLDQLSHQRVWFDFSEGKIRCAQCQPPMKKNGAWVSKGTLKQISWLYAADIKKADRIKLPEFALAEAGALLEAFIPFHMGREFRSLKFLNRLRQEKWT